MTKQDEILDHDYDGIQEFDNPLPRWWIMSFYATIVFGFFYVMFYHAGPGKSQDQILAEDMARIRASEKAAKDAEPPPSEEALLAIMADASRREQGKKTYAEKCAACHGIEGAGMIGPNLTDAYWIHGKGGISDLLLVVSDGVPDKGMPPWKTMLPKDELLSVVAYVKTLNGTNPSNPKAPQGTKY